MCRKNGVKMATKKPTKYEYLYVLQGNYGYGWEDLTAAEKTYEGLKEIKSDRKAYRENEPGTPLRVIERRVLRGKK
jgi:hypothetical protein